MNNARIEVLENAIRPRRARSSDAGLDIALQEDIVIFPGETYVSPAKVKLFLPTGMCAHIMTRSSTHKKRVHIIPTVIDKSYNGEISIFVSNFNSYPVELKRGDYVAQIVLMPYFTFENEDEPMFVSERSENDKFGSTDNMHEFNIQGTVDNLLDILSNASFVSNDQYEEAVSLLPIIISNITRAYLNNEKDVVFDGESGHYLNVIVEIADALPSVIDFVKEVVFDFSVGKGKATIIIDR